MSDGEAELQRQMGLKGQPESGLVRGLKGGSGLFSPIPSCARADFAWQQMLLPAKNS